MRDGICKGQKNAPLPFVFNICIYVTQSLPFTNARWHFLRDGICKGQKTPLHHLYLTSSHSRWPSQMRHGIFGPLQIRDDDRVTYMQMSDAHGKGATAFCRGWDVNVFGIRAHCVGWRLQGVNKREAWCEGGRKWG